MSETEAKERNIPYRLSKIPVATILRTRTVSETKGFVKALVDSETDRILGCMAITVNAGEVIAPIQVAMMAQLPFTAFRDAPFTHPTMSEGLVPLFEGVPTAPVAKAPLQKRSVRMVDIKVETGGVDQE